MTSSGLEIVQVVLVSITGTCIFGVLIVWIFSLRFRKNKVFRASSPGLLYTSLFGSALLYSECIVSLLHPTPYICMMAPCLHYAGFTFTYASLTLKTWRVAVIMQVVKSQVCRLRDAALYKILAVFIAITVAYLLIWAVIKPVPVLTYANRSRCQVTWWNFCGVVIEVIFVTWGITQCVRARKAPSLYNDTKVIGFVLYNQGAWIVFSAIVGYILQWQGNKDFPMYLVFLRTQMTVTITLALVFGSKFHEITSSFRELHGTLADVYGERRTHRLALIVNKYGDIKNIYCNPCGPLNYTETSVKTSSDNDVVKDTGYSEAEIDRLVTLLSKLRNEKEMYRLQVEQLQKVLKLQCSGLLKAKIVTKGRSDGSVIDPTSTFSFEHNNRNRKHGNLSERHKDAQRLDITTPQDGDKTGCNSTVTTYVSSRSEPLTLMSIEENSDKIRRFNKPDINARTRRLSANLVDFSPYANDGTSSSISSPKAFNCIEFSDVKSSDKTMWPLVDLKPDTTESTISPVAISDESNSPLSSRKTNIARRPTDLNIREYSDVSVKMCPTSGSTSDVSDFPVLVTTDTRKAKTMNLSPSYSYLTNDNVVHVLNQSDDESNPTSPKSGDFVMNSEKMTFIMYI